MRGIRVTMAAACRLAALGALAALVAATAGCAGAAGGTAAGAAPGRSAAGLSGTAAAVPRGQQAEIYEAVLRRYLGTPAENSFPGRTFKTAYVLNQAYAGAADPNGERPRAPGERIGAQTQREVAAALAGMAHIVFIADRGSVIEARNGCQQVKNGAILITLGLPAGHAGETRVGINGFVACLGATWLTYVLREQPGAGWRITGTTGSMAVA